MNLIIDAGNTYSKIGRFENETLVGYTPQQSFENVVSTIEQERPVNIMFSSVSYTVDDLRRALSFFPNIINLDANTSLPISKNYDTPETLGTDRVAACVGANFLFPGEDLLVIDMGTCITYDLINRDAVFQGGIISPGMRMRFKAMHTFTKRLPLVDPEKEAPLIGKSTRSAMQSGVMNGIAAEIEGIIQMYRHKSPFLRVVMCGGDSSFFESRAKPPIFAVPELVLIGLNRILIHNVSPE